MTQSDLTPISALTQGADDLVGTWRLISASAVTHKGERNEEPYGLNPSGFLTYTQDGRVSALVSYSGRKPLSGDRIAAPLSERAEAFATFFAYAGRFSVSGNTVVHRVEIASVPNWVGTDLVRIVERDGNRIKLRTPPLQVGGVATTSELVWERTLGAKKTS